MNAVTTIQPRNLAEAVQQFDGQVANLAPQLKKALPSHISIDKFQRTLMAAVKADPELLKADRASLFNACEKAALDSLLPDKREAALVVFKRNFKDGQGAWQSEKLVQYMPMVYGLRKKILQSNEVTDITAKVVYRVEVEKGAFIYEEGTEAMLRHKPLLDMTEEDASDDQIVAAYSMATYKDGTKSYEVMRRFEIDKVRESSQTGATKDKRGKPRTPSGPWVDWYPEQCKKTVMRRHSKTLPMSGDLIVDMEARDDEAYARSAASMLDVKPDAPVALPSGDDWNSQESNDAEQVDADTGEVLQQDSRGMTEVDEDTARELDADESGASAEQQGQVKPDENRRQAEAFVAQMARDFAKAKTDDQKRSARDHYADPIGKLEQHFPDLHEEALAMLPEVPDEDDEPAWKKPLEGLRTKLGATKSVKAVEGVERDWLNLVRAAVDDEQVVSQFEAEIAARKKSFIQPSGNTQPEES